MYIQKYFSSERVKEFLQKTSGYDYIKLQELNYSHESFSNCISFLTAFGTIKFLKLLRFNARVYLLAFTLKSGASELANFGILFLILWLTMVQMFYFYFNNKMAVFSTFVKSMETCFQMMLGKFQVDPLIKAHFFLGPVFFLLFNILIVIFLINIFVSILNECFIMAKRDAEKHFADYDILSYFKNKFSFLSKEKKIKEDNNDR